MLRINVTQRDIDRGTAGDSSSCPVALALRRKGFPNCGVGVTRLWRDVHDAGFFLSPEAKKFVADFDEGKKVKPFTFIVGREVSC